MNVLGVQFDSKLSWSEHVNKTINKAKRTHHAINLIKKYFVSNQHRVTVEMKPDLELEEKQRLEEESRLARAKESMSEQQVQLHCTWLIHSVE